MAAGLSPEKKRNGQSKNGNVIKGSGHGFKVSFLEEIPVYLQATQQKKKKLKVQIKGTFI